MAIARVNGFDFVNLYGKTYIPMNQIRYIFSLVIEFVDRTHFCYLVRKYNGDHYVMLYTCWNQLLTLIFGQLSRSHVFYPKFRNQFYG